MRRTRGTPSPTMPAAQTGKSGKPARKRLTAKERKFEIELAQEFIESARLWPERFEGTVEGVCQCVVEDRSALPGYALGRLLDQAQRGSDIDLAKLEKQVRKALGLGHAPVAAYRDFALAWDKAGRSLDDLSKFPSIQEAADSVGIEMGTAAPSTAVPKTDGPAVRSGMLAAVADGLVVARLATGKKAKRNWCRALNKVIRTVNMELKELERGLKPSH